MNSTTFSKLSEPVSKQVKAALKDLDLKSVKLRLMDKQEGPGWPSEKVDHVEAQYKRFLWLLFKYRDEKIVPSKEIDEFWHYHVLDTRKYFTDCEDTFGHFIHHNPNFGRGSEEEKKQLQQSYIHTKKLYVSEFGQSATYGDSLSTDEHSVPNACSGSDCSSSVQRFSHQ